MSPCGIPQVPLNTFFLVAIALNFDTELNHTDSLAFTKSNYSLCDGIMHI